ncbi:acetyl-CoA carboxylase carboxyltransferase subunit alpha [Nitrospina watsonii]|uniref:Acetyl-coenzyme A carboxylase carboxyl transferase subunit alpha n=1 Tax=Nitrospina watsonii TaxID=1323948 RepID=A0ABN8W0R5_9BACT|nr:acetyl-CoA carboxylase carboxyltransferase subunit alpha [Nitrospina watsonii]CAI2717806.1 acetyl-CoA carboxyltransferase subunit alpha [Nitrospina watsonii]
MVQILDFEKEIFSVENQIRELVSLSHMYDSIGDISHEIAKLRKKLRRMKYDTFNNLDGWQKTQVARHPMRPYTMDYINAVFTDFQELSGDRHGGLGASIIGGMAKFGDLTVMIIGHQKGRDTKEKLLRNFGMSQPAAYRKALRLMEMAEKFNVPIVTFIDTPGAYPGVDAEEKGQSEAIARNLFVMAGLKVPMIATIIGEGGSGGALAIGMGNKVLMLEHSVYSVISPEGCASILWDDKEKVKQAADALCLTAQQLITMKVIDQVVAEPLGGAHRNHKRATILLKKALRSNLNALTQMTPDQLVQQRHEKFRNLGEFVTGTVKD